MARISLPKLFRQMAFKPSRKRGIRPFKLFLEDVEDRVVPATIPQPVLDPTFTATAVAAGSGPQLVVNPLNSNQRVIVSMTESTAIARTTIDGGNTWMDVSGFAARRTDPTIAQASPPTSYAQSSSPAVAFGRDGTLYFVYLTHNATKSSGMVMFQRATFNTTGATTISTTIRLYQWTGTDPALNPIIAVDNNLNTDPVTGLITGDTDTMITAANKSKGVYIAWNGNATPVAGDLSRPDPTAANAPNPSPILTVVSADDGDTWSNPTPISDGGYLRSGSLAAAAAPQIVFTPSNSNSPGRLMFLWPQQNSGAVMYQTTQPDGGVAGNTIAQAYTYFAPTLTSATGAVPDGVQDPSSSSNPDSHAPKTFSLTVPAGTIPFPPTVNPAFSLTDLQVWVQFVSPQLDHIRIQLQGPAGTITLLDNRIDPLGNGTGSRGQENGATFTNGVPPPPAIDRSGPNSIQPSFNYQGLGVQNGRVNTGAIPNNFFSHAIFSNQGARKINDPNTTFPYIGVFRPEVGTTASATLASLAGGTTAAAINGSNWNLIIEDFRDDRYIITGSSPPIPYDAPQYLATWGLTFSGLNFTGGTAATGADQATGVTGTSIGADPTIAPGSPTKPATAPSNGIPGSISITFDTTLGNEQTLANGSFGGNMYIAYTTGGTDVNITRFRVQANGLLQIRENQKVNNDRASDNYTEGNRQQFIPSVAVDTFTGTVVMTWFDARLDANNSRAATFVSSSNDGGNTWTSQDFNTTATGLSTGSLTPQVPLPFLNQPKQAFDVVTGTRYTLQPVPSNVELAGANDLGIRQALYVEGGTIWAYWGGNQNAAGVSVLSSRAFIASGPRIVSGTLGLVAGNVLDRFTVAFDRRLLAGSVTTGSARLRYHNPYDPTGTDTVIPVTGVIDNLDNTYTFTFTPQTAVGTYSYEIDPDGNPASIIRDDIWHYDGPPIPANLVQGNYMDQDADGTPNEANVDSFAIPTPVNGIPFAPVYVSTSLPLIIPGPTVASTTVPGFANSLVLGNNAAYQLDVTFDRLMNTDPTFGPVFGPSNIVRIIGPSGVIYDRATAASNPLTVTAVGVTPPTPTATFRIGFPSQVLSGTYTLEIDPLFVSSTNLGSATRLAYVDTNQNAGLSVLRGGSPTTGVASNSTYNASFNATSTPTAGIPAASGAIPSVKEYPITVPDSYVIALSAGHQIQVQVNVSSAIADNTSVVDLSGELVAPDGTVVRLFTNVGNPLRTPGTLWFSNTLFNDAGGTPIQTGFQPFDSGPYNPQFPLGNLNGKGSNGTWLLRIFNSGTHTPDLTGWSLSLPQISGGTGLGEAYADRFTVSFRVFNQDPASALTQNVWTAVGPAAGIAPAAPNPPTPPGYPAGPIAGRVTALAVDPSDPSGNTVYAGGGSGGIWKTTNFLTTSAGGPVWTPLGDSGPANSLNISSIAIFPRNADPAQSIIFALTGEGNASGGINSPGVGVLRSMDGGRTWVVLDSVNNTDSPTIGTGSILPIASPARARQFQGTSGYKIVVDPVPGNNPDKDVLVYMATSSGVWRSSDTGRHWTLLRGGYATDVVLSEGSAATVGNPNLQILYAAFRNDGVYIANPAYVATSMTNLSGSPGGNASYIQFDTATQQRVGISAPADTPNGAKGRIMLVSPALSAGTIQNINYQAWLYALVVTPGGGLNGLYVTKDYGQNWTKISLANLGGWGTNNYTRGDYDMFAAGGGNAFPFMPGQGNEDIGFAIDPNNPHVVYIGGTTNNVSTNNRGLIRVDTTGLQDASAIIPYDNSSTPPGNIVQYTFNGGNINVGGAGGQYTLSSRTGGPNVNTGYLNVLRDPDGQFVASPIYFTNVTQINNKGWGARFTGFFSEIGTGVHRLITVRDQNTGLTRLIVGGEQGVSSALDNGSGSVLSNIGGTAYPALNRNGNLQLTQFNSSTAQPGQLAAEIASALFYGTSRDNGFPTSTDDILQTGGGAVLDWAGSGVDKTGAWGLTDQTGSGTYYDYRWPCCGGDHSNFFRVNGISRTFFLLQSGDNPTTNSGQWPWMNGFKFVVNPIDPNGIMISNNSGRVFRTTDQGVTWFVVNDPNGGAFNSYAQALAYGSPDPIFPDQFNNFLYAGTAAGQIFVTRTGGAPWTPLSAGLSGGAVQQIIPDPTRGSNAAYAVTTSGVFYMADSNAPGATWVNVTGDLLNQSKPIFSEVNDAPQTGLPALFGGVTTIPRLTSLAVDWRYAIPVDPQDPSAGSFPVLYVGGNGGVARSLDRGLTWHAYPVGTQYTYTDPLTNAQVTIDTPDGGYFPSVPVTQLTLSQGNIDPSSGQPIQQTGGLNMLTASTFGRGTWMIRLGTADKDPAIAAITQYQVVKQSGPRVIAVTPTASGASTNTFRVQFDSPVLASTFTFNGGDIALRDANGNPFTINSVTPVVDNSGPFAPYRVAIPTGAAVGDYHDVFDITVTRPAGYTPFPGGFAEITIGEKIYDYAGFGMNQDDDFYNGESTPSADNGGAAEDAYHGYLVLSAAAPTGNLHIDQPMIATAGEPTRVVISAMNPATGRPNAGYTGTITMDATVNGRRAVLTHLPVFQIKDLTDNGAGNVTATTLVPLSADIIPGRRIVVGGVATAVYNTTDLANGDLVISVAADRLSFVYQHAAAAGAAPDRAGGGNVTGPFVPVATTSATPAPYPTGLFPTTYTYTAGDAGTHVFAVFYIGASGPPSQTQFSVTDTAGGVSPAQSYVTVDANRARQFVLQGVSPVTAGDTHTWTLKAVDQYGNIDTNYTGTVTITSDDPQASFAPTTYTFTSLDAGVKNVDVTLRTAGLITVTATDAVTNAPAVITGTHTVRVMPATPTTITVSGFPSPTVAGVAHDYTVSLFDAFGNLATNYAGTVTMSNNDPYTGPGAHFNPSSYTFTAYDEYNPAIEDAGTHTFTNGATLYTAGTRFIRVSDTSLGIQGSQIGITVVPAAMSQFVVSGFPSPTAAGTSKSFTVRAADPYGNRISGYTGKVQLSTSDLQGSFVPASALYTFTVADAGQHGFTANLKTAGLQSITAKDVNTPALTGTQSNILITPLAASSVQVSGMASPRTAGTDGDFTVTFRDIYNNVATGYTGNVVFSSTDSKATFLPASYTFTGADAGQRTFVNGANLKTTGTWSIRATAGVFVGAQNGIVVNPAAATVAVVTGHTSPVVAGTPSDFTVELRDPFGNRDTNFTGTVTFTSDDPQAAFSSASYPFIAGDAGIHTFIGGSTLKTAGTRSITATSGAITGSQTGIVVTPNAATHFDVTAFPATTTAGVAHNFTVTARDAYGNVATGYLGTVAFTSDDLQATFAPASHTFTSVDAGVFIVSGTLKTAGVRSITATDTVSASITGTQTPIQVDAAATSQFIMDFPSPVTAGVQQSFTVRAADPYGNTTTGYTGTVTLTSSDIQAVFSPSNIVLFGVSDNGVVALTGELRTAGTQSITADDGVLSGTQTGILVNPNVANYADVTGFPTPTVAGVAHSFTVTVRDIYGNVATGYTGTMSFFSNDDAQATFAPASHPFTAGDAGVFTGSATLRTAGTRSITAMDGSISGTQFIDVVAAAASRVDVLGFPASTTAGIAHDFTVTLYDPFNNVATGFLGTMTFTSDDPQATLPSPYPFTAGDAGTHTFVGGATLRTVGLTRYIRGTSGALSGQQTPIVVTPAATAKFVVEGFQSPITAGVSDVFTVRATDAFDNTTPSYTGTATLTSSDSQAIFSPSATVVFGASDNGSKNVTGQLRTAATQSITANDGSFSGSQTGIVVTPAAASQVFVTGFPATTVAGVAGSFTVTLRDPFNNIATGYTGTMSFTSSDGQATFSPATYPFTAGDAGVKTFTNGATLRTAGTQSITAGDGSISGSQTSILVTPAATSQFLTNFPSPVTAGVAQNFTLRAADPYGNTTPTYTGSVSLSSNDPQATFSLANPIAFTGSDAGVRSLNGTLRTSGTRSISATDGTFSGTQNGILVNAAAPASVVVSGVPSPTTAGIARTFTVSIRDAFNNVATSYVGTMTFTSSDGQATFAPGSHPFTATDAGQRTFSSGVTLRTAGPQTITATDSFNALSGTQNVTVTPAAASQVILSGFPGTTTAGDPHDFTVTLRDPFNNVATGYTGTLIFSSSDGQATFTPANHTFTGGDAGIHTFPNGATLRTAGTQSLTATDGAISGTLGGIVVTPAATSQFITNFPSPTTAGVAQNFTVRAADPYGNTTPTYTGTATLSSNDPQAGFSSTTVPFTVADNGVRPVTGTLRTAGSRSISVNDGTFSGTQSGILVTPAAASSLVVSNFPSPTVAGVAHDFTVTAFDPFNNIATGYTGTVTFTSNDPQVAFAVPNFPFTAGDGGTHTFVNGATLKTSGTRTLIASDGVLSGTQANIQVNSAAAASLNITGFPSTVRATDDQAFTVTARDAFNNVAAGYSGTVAFSSTDPFGTFVPGPYTFGGGDAGTHVFVGNLSTPGLQSFTVQDTGNAGLTASQNNIAVTPGPVASFTLTGAPATAQGGTAFPMTVRALDRFGRPLTTYNGTVNFTSSDPYAVLPASLTLVNGVAVANFTLHTPAVRSITVRDSVNAAATGSTNINVFGGTLQPAVVTHRFGVGAGGGANLNLYEADGTFVRTYQPFGPGFTGGVRTSVADFNLDGVPDVAAGSGPGITAEVKIFDGVTNAVIFDIQPFADFTGGVFVSAGSIKADGFPDLLVTPDRGGGPRVSVFHGGSFTKIADFYGIDDPNFRGGARASAGDFNGDGKDDVIVSAGFLGGPRIAIFDGAALLGGLQTRLVGDFFAFEQSLRDGAYVAAGDVNGDGFADAIFGAGPGGGPRTTVVDGRALLSNPNSALQTPMATFFTGDYTKRGGIREAIKDIDGDGFADLIVGDGEDVGSSVRIYLGVNLKDGSIGREFSFRAFPEVNAGVYVG